MNLKDLPLRIQGLIKGVRKVTVSNLGPLVIAANGRYLCRWCQKEVPMGRKRYWCSNACVDAFKRLQCCPDGVYNRDGGRCRICQKDISELQMHLDKMWATYRHIMHLDKKIRRGEEIEKSFGDNAQGYWIANQDDFSTFQDLVNEMRRYSKIFNEYLHQDENGVYHPKHTKAYHIDHILPVAEGGTTTLCNLRLVCTWCSEKLSAEQAHRRALRNRNGA